MKEKIIEQLKIAMDKMNVVDIPIVIEKPKDSKNGDFSSNIAMQLTKELKKSPKDIASAIIEAMDSSLFKKIEIAGPGFINFFVDKSYLTDHINQILKEKENYGRSTIGNNKKINVEFVSANPTGYIHVGTSRCAAYGDNLCRLLDFAGYDVTREYYFNDGGVQIENLGKSLQARYFEQCGQVITFPENGYHGLEIVEIAKKLFSEVKDSKLESERSFFSQYASDYLIEIIKEDLKDFRVSFDVWTSEQAIKNSGNVEKCLEILKEQGDLYESEGATWFKTTKYGDDKDRVLIKNDGNYTYLVPDIAYHLDKMNRGFEEIVDVLGADHHGYINRLKASVEALGYDKNKIFIKIVQMVRLLRGGEEIKMSKRTGQTVTMRELMEDVGINASRYFFAARSLDSQMDFDLDLATKNSNENPVYYISYAYARINAVLEKYKKESSTEKYVTINDEASYNVLEYLYDFKETVENAALKKLPHLIANYTYDLSNAFHSYYEKNRIISEDEQMTMENISLIKAVKITLENALNLIGVIPPQKM